MAQLVALLRGINLGRNRRVSMATLRELLEADGYEEVRTHLQSGNVIVRTRQSPAAAGPAIETLIEDRFGFPVEVVVRTQRQLASIVADDPLAAVAADPAKRIVIFLSKKPTAARLHELAEQDLGSERCEVRGAEVHAWCPDGVQASAVMKALDRLKLAPVATARNWKTVTKLLEMASE